MRPRGARVSLPALVAAGAVLALAACGADPSPEITTSDVERRVVTVGQASGVTEVVLATDRFGIGLLASGSVGENMVVSPASVVIALSMVADGANGETAEHLDAALGASGTDRTDAINALLTELQVYAGDPAVIQEKELPEQPMAHVANQVVLDDEFTAHQDYLDALARGYGAGVLKTDLGSAAGKKALDAWVRLNTGGLIEESAIQPDPDLRLVLQNAVVLAARWNSPFEEDSTQPGEFSLSSQERVTTQMLNQSADFAYAEADGWQAVRLPYNVGFHADVLLPPPGVDPVSVPPEIRDHLSTTLTAAAPVAVHLTMPSVDLEPDPLDLKPALFSAGLGDLFDAPDLSGISAQTLVLSQAMQQARLAVDEAGTIAAAVTELGFAETSAPMPVDEIEFLVDRPYLFSIAHTETAWTLFLAAISDPRH